MDPKPKDGAAFVVRQRNRKYNEITGNRWQRLFILPSGKEKFLGTTTIDGSSCNVWSSPEGVWFWAQPKFN